MYKLSLIILISILIACSGKTNNKARQEHAVSKEDKEHYLEKGKAIADKTQAVLLKTVQGAMAEGGPTYAIDFCNLEALSIKDSLSQLTDSKIQRLSLKYRNPVDKPQTQTELDQLNAYQTAFEKGASLVPNVHMFDDRVEYYQPIKVAKGACLLCHGEPGTQIANETLKIINERYPNDLATGYALNDFRGVWKVTFRR